MKNYLILLMIIPSACVSYSGPKEDITISANTKIGDLAGLYLNDGEPSGFLSKIVWGTEPLNAKYYKTVLDHNKIVYLKVISKDNFVSVKAITRECVAHEENYVLGEDFKINGGEIIMDKKTTLHPHVRGDPMVGVSSKKVVLALDDKGDGIYRNENIAGGLVFAFVPAIFAKVEEIRFMKIIDNNKQYRLCYER